MNKLLEKNIVNDAIIKDLIETIYSLEDGDIYINIKRGKINRLNITKKNDFHDVWQVEDGGGI